MSQKRYYQETPRLARAVGLCLLLAACRVSSAPPEPGSKPTEALPAATATPTAMAAGSAALPEGFRQWDELGVTLLLPEKWGPAADAPTADQAGHRLAVLDSKEKEGSASLGRVLILRLTPGESWEKVLTGLTTGWKKVGDGASDRATFEGSVPDPTPYLDDTRGFVNGEVFVLFECEFSTDEQRRLCDGQLEHLYLHGEAVDPGRAVGGPGYRFEPPLGWTRQSNAGDSAERGSSIGFTTPEQPGFRLTLAGVRLQQKESADAVLDRYQRLMTSKSKGEVKSVTRLTYAGCPGIRVITTRPPPTAGIAVSMMAARVASPEGDAVVACEGQKTADFVKTCETVLRSAKLRPSALGDAADRGR